jgi:uncharacterized Zn-finger protein
MTCVRSHFHNFRKLTTSIKCDLCGKTFSWSGHLNTQNKLKSTHMGVKLLQFDLCVNTFSQSGNLNKHKCIYPLKCDFGYDWNNF